MESNGDDDVEFRIRPTARTRVASGRGGWRPNAGRPPGAVGKMNKEARARAAATGELPHEFLLRVSRGEVIRTQFVDDFGVVQERVEVYDFDKRVDAAKAAAPYYAPKISTVEVISGMNEDDLDSIIARLAAEAGISLGDVGESPQNQGEEERT